MKTHVITFLLERSRVFHSLMFVCFAVCSPKTQLTIQPTMAYNEKEIWKKSYISFNITRIKQIPIL